MKLFKKQDKVDVDRFYNALEDWIFLLEKERGYSQERADHERKNIPSNELELAVNFDSETQTQPITHTKARATI